MYAGPLKYTTFELVWWCYWAYGLQLFIMNETRMNHFLIFSFPSLIEHHACMEEPILGFGYQSNSLVFSTRLMLHMLK